MKAVRNTLWQPLMTVRTKVLARVNTDIDKYGDR